MGRLRLPSANVGSVLAAAFTLLAIASGSRAATLVVSGPAPPTLEQQARKAAAAEARRYADDSAAFFTAPLHWKTRDWERAGGVALVLGGLFAADETLNHEAQAHRTAATDRVASAVTSLGGVGAFAVAGAYLAGGLIGHSRDATDIGREALEASVISGLFDNLVLKPALGRRRPNVTGGETDFEPISKNASFPSGDATEAFAVATVIAVRSRGWVVPTAAYTLASLVGFERMNRNVHFASDVVAGALIGIVTARFLVSRHDAEASGGGGGISLELESIPHGLGARIEF